MSEHIEIEFKNILLQEEFEALKKTFRVKEEDFFRQVNYYFDTEAYSLKNSQSALRVRQKGDKYELTVKEPAGQGLLETTQELSVQEAEAFISGGPIPTGKPCERVSLLGADPSALICFGSLTTDRAEQPYKDGLLVFDRSSYLGKVDYELEYEVTDAEAGEKIFEELLFSLHIPLRQTENKIRRLYQAKLKP